MSLRREEIEMDYARYLIRHADFTHGMDKEAIWSTLRAGAKALGQSFWGGTRMQAPAGVFQRQRALAAARGQSLMGHLQRGGMSVHRARVKSPQSIQAKGLTRVPDDLLGMQIYGRAPGDVARVIQLLRGAGAQGLKASGKVRPGYQGINIKGTYRGTPMEMQVSPGRISNMGQMMEHSLGYKQLTEMPRATWLDKWFGRKMAPWMVNRSWIPQQRQPLQQLGVTF
jgi:hypothetical protein